MKISAYDGEKPTATKTCSYCGKSIFTNQYTYFARRRCDATNKVKDSGYNYCSLSCATNAYSKYEGARCDICAKTTCSSCKGTGEKTTTVKCSHTKTATHAYCSHEKTEQHDD